MGKSYCHEDGGYEGDYDDEPSTSVNEVPYSISGQPNNFN